MKQIIHCFFLFLSMISFSSLAMDSELIAQSDGYVVKVKKEFLYYSENLLSSLKGVKSLQKLKVKSQDLFLVIPDDDHKNRGNFLSYLRQNEIIALADPNFIYTIEPVMEGKKRFPYSDIQTELNDPMFNRLWGLNNSGVNELSDPQLNVVVGADISALKAWEITKGDRKIKIAVIDTGIDYTHPDLRDNIFINFAELNGNASSDDDGNGFVDDIYGYDFANGDGDPMDDNRHGTHCAGTIGAIHNNLLGGAGVMNEVTLVPLKFLTGAGSGSLAHAIEAIDYGINLGVDIMSNSWGGGGYSDLLKEAIEKARDAGIIFIAAAGNSSVNNDSFPHYPSNYDVENVISVAAHNASDTLAGFSCYGRKTVHVVAPGQDIWSTVPNQRYESLSGTSMATPHVSGVVGLLLAKEGRIDFSELKNRLMYSSSPSDNYLTKVKAKGRVNAYNFLMDIRPITPDPVPVNWQKFTLDETFESLHPYEINQLVSKSYTIEGAKFIRVVVDKMELENGYDYILIKNKEGIEIDKISGKSDEPKFSEFVTGDTVNLEFKSDSTINQWGFIITTLEFTE